ncbi:NAD(P)H-dependent glycerol-3-phosphate dehydrogenase [Crassaminicella thermophila]|uniref:Glycerol-3-phosphate dehydrogenase [NAD(P)+] n=1 Tax=Crassaminicella thermophila TaxID=2599308 RepID=A0A5C0SDZ0_CRATE|nr:NAD(P)H-dependent glycerol-3-phosphate dehydrogenase [Crassaminicella thermophila]QEK11976.1 NAD(P)H-dependent glycerol-3-phosphate dehydrogenase [Crassaminicella thermophila]
MKSSICVIGAGSWGTALAISLSKKGHNVRLWMRNEEQLLQMKKSRENIKYLPGVILPDNIKLFHNILHAVKDADIILLTISSQAVRETIKKFKEAVHDKQIIVNAAKGLENNTLLRISEVVKEELSQNAFAVLSGPSHAEEVCRDMPTTLVVASDSKSIAEYIQDVFISPKLRVYTNPDVIGVELGGSLKNVIALGAGISDGLGFGDNAKAALMTRGIAEIARLGQAMGADINTFAGLTGIGDLIVTCTSMHSRNRRCGIEIGKGKKLEEAVKSIGMVVEGVVTTEVAYKLSMKYGVEMPITTEIYNILYKNSDAREAVVNLMMRSKTHEIEEVVINKKFNW